MKGRTWCVSFEDSAKKDGDVQVRYMVTDSKGNPMEIKGVWEGYKKGDSPNIKATRFFNALNSPPYNDLVGVVRAGNTVCFQLKDDAPYQDINGVEVGDQTGQNFNIYDDPDKGPGSGSLETVRFRIEGTPTSANGEVRLGLGQVAPMARVPTFVDGAPQTTAAILEALVDVFNGLYESQGYQANVDGDEVVIPDVPCELGTRGGSDDLGLDYWITMVDPNAGLFSRNFDKASILRDAIRLVNARLDIAGIRTAKFADPQLLTFVPVAVGGPIAVAAKQWAFTVVNTTGQAANDVHITLAFSGGTLRNPRIIIEPCPNNPGTATASGNRVDIVWPTPCVQPGDAVGVIVDTNFVPLQLASVIWTLNGTPIAGQGDGMRGGVDDRTVLALPDDGGLVGDPAKLGPNGWPTDPGGNEVIPPFTHADQFFIECWTPQPNRTIGVKGSLCGLFRWDCDLLATHISQLRTAIEGVWGANSDDLFRRGNNPGQPALGQPNYPPGFDAGGNLNPFRKVEQLPQVGTGRVVINIGNCAKYFDEQGANYMLMWLEQRFSACCL